MSGRIPLHVITGFLGSGKTTLLNRILREPAWADSAVLINEIGAVSIDHHLVDRIETGDNLDVVVLQGGCTCCALRGDMVAALRELYQRRADGTVPRFARVVLETTGLADPAPVLFTLRADAALRHKFEPGNVVATFDAVHGIAQLARYPESRKQIAVADYVTLTKTDLEESHSRSQLSNEIGRINPAAFLSDGRNTAVLSDFLDDGHRKNVWPNDAYDSHKSDDETVRSYEAHKQSNAFSALSNDTYEADKSNLTGSKNIARHFNNQSILSGAEKLGGKRSFSGQFVAEDVAEHTPDIASVTITLDEPVEWSAFAVWLTLLLHAHGEKMLRFKALMNVTGWENPVALHGIHHMIHPPVHLDGWPAGPRVSRLVFIAQGLEMARIEPSLRRFLAGDFAI